MAAAGFLFKLAAIERVTNQGDASNARAIFSRIIFATLKSRARRVLSCGEAAFADVKEKAGGAEYDAARLLHIAICATWICFCVAQLYAA